MIFLPKGTECGDPTEWETLCRRERRKNKKKRHTDKMIDKERQANGQRRHEGDSALLHRQHENGNHELSGEDNLNEEALRDGHPGTERRFRLKLPWQESGYEPSSGKTARKLHCDVAKQPYPINGSTKPQTQRDL